MPWMNDEKISQSTIDGGIEITSEQYALLLINKLDGKKVVVRNGEPFVYSMEKRTVYSLVDNAVISKEILSDDLTPDGWQDIAPEVLPVDHTVASKLKLLDYFDGIGLYDNLMTIIKSDDKRYQRWLVAGDINMNDPMVSPVRTAMGWTEQQLQDLFNDLNA